MVADQNRAVGQLAKKAGVSVSEVTAPALREPQPDDVPAFGLAKIGNRPATEAPTRATSGGEVLETVGKRGAHHRRRAPAPPPSPRIALVDDVRGLVMRQGQSVAVKSNAHDGSTRPSGLACLCGPPNPATKSSRASGSTPSRRRRSPPPTPGSSASARRCRTCSGPRPRGPAPCGGTVQRHALTDRGGSGLGPLIHGHAPWHDMPPDRPAPPRPTRRRRRRARGAGAARDACS